MLVPYINHVKTNQGVISVSIETIKSVRLPGLVYVAR